MNEQIIQLPNKVLRAKASAVCDFQDQELSVLIQKMALALFRQPDGIGIAAPQIGASVRIFLVAADVLDAKLLEKRIHAPASARQIKNISESQYITFINPKILKYSSKKNSDVEGCLSVRGLYGEVSRPEKVTVEYYDIHGKKHSRGASGLFARVILHEMDHLEGMLFIDKAKNTKKIEHTNINANSV